MPDRSIRLHVPLGLILAASLAVLGLGILARLSVGFVLDDAFMFVRYADRILSEGRLAWNPGGEPIYGPTFLLFLGVVLPIRALLPGEPALSAALSSLVCGIVFIALLPILLRRTDSAGATHRRVFLALVFLILAASTSSLASHFVSGMDTTFALAYLTGYLLLCLWAGRREGKIGALAMGLCGGLAFSARPDLLVYTLLVPVCMTVFGADREAKRNGLWALALTVAAIGVQITGSWYLLRSPLPLSFYAKGMVGYGDIFASHYRLVPFVELTHYVASYWPLLLVIGLDLVVSRRQWRSGISPVERALLVATCLFVLYYAFFVLQIMHRPQRFYYPTLPALVFLAAQGGARLAGAIPKPISAELERLPRWAVVGFAILLGGLLLRPAVTAAVELRRKATRGRLLNFDVVANYRDRYTDYWFGLDAFSDLPDDLVVATTEIGRPAALNPHKQIVDMTGLNERAFAHEGFSADRLLLNHRPDLIYMPHPHYEDMATQLIKHPVFAAQYERFSGAELGAEMGLALRRESRYYRHMARIVRERIQHTHRRPH